MNSRLQFLIRKNTGKRLWATYLHEVSKLTVSNNYELLCLEESDIITSKSIAENEGKFHSSNCCCEYRDIPFSDKCRLKDVITNIQSRYSGSVYMSLGYSDVCGLIALKQINVFNADFYFNDEHSGLIVLYDTSVTNKLIIDFYEEDGLLFYDLELYGKEWNVTINGKTHKTERYPIWDIYIDRTNG